MSALLPHRNGSDKRTAYKCDDFLELQIHTSAVIVFQIPTWHAWPRQCRMPKLSWRYHDMRSSRLSSRPAESGTSSEGFTSKYRRFKESMETGEMAS